MHRVDPKRQKKAALRFAAYTITIVLTVLTTVVLLYIALGYRLDRESGNVVRSGLLLVDTKPEAAQIYINNEQKDTEAPGRFVLSAGTYDLSLRRSGYRQWDKQVSVLASGVREVNYPLLIPQTLRPKTLVEAESPALASQSLDRKYLLTQVANQANLTLTEFNADSPKQTILSLTSAVNRENGQIGTLRVIEWALNNKQVLIEQTLPGGGVNLLSLDVTKPAEIINISSLYGAQAPTDVHYVGGKTNQIYGVREGILKRYSLEKAESEVLLQNVRSYQPYSDDTILFDRTASQNIEIGIWRDKVSTVVETSPSATQPALLKYARYDDNDYFVIAHSDGDVVTVYKDPTKKPILAKQLPLTKMQFAKPTKIDFSLSSQFILAQNGSSFATYDLEDLVQNNVNVPFTVAANSFNWLDAFHLQVRADSGEAYILDYDGKNMQKIIPLLANTRLYFAPNYRYMYSFVASNQNAALQSTALVVSAN